MGPLILLYLMKNSVLKGFLKFYVMGSPGIDLFGISHVKVDLIPVLKMYVLPMLEIFDLNYRICTMWRVHQISTWARGMNFKST